MSAGTITYQVKLKNRFSIAERTMAFQFEKPAGFVFKPGQWIDITLLDPSETDAEGNVRGFSIASAPEDELLMVATRMRDTAFKRELAKTPLDTEVKITPAGGSFVLHNNSARTAVILAGGIGITPIRSILLHATRQHLPHRIVLFFSNKNPKDAPFLKELEALQTENGNFKFVPTMTDTGISQSQWGGETGRIDKKMLGRHLSAAESALYYIVGPQGLVRGLQKMLNESGVDDDDIQMEEFSGY